MPPESTRAVLLGCAPYQESSSLLYLYTRRFGLVHGIAKGIRKTRKEHVPIERGLLLECALYHKPNATLFTLGAVSLVNGYPGIRENLLKSAVRDTAFDIARKTIHADEPNDDLYGFFERFLDRLDKADTQQKSVALLWQFLNGFSKLLGFGCDFTNCYVCGVSLQSQPGSLNIENGGVSCPRCTPPGAGFSMLSAQERLLIRGIEPPSGEHANTGAADQGRISRLLATYCLHHGESRSESKALTFLCGLIE